MGDLGTTGLILLGLNQGEGDRQDKEKRQEDVAEIHGCELPLLMVDAMESRREKQGGVEGGGQLAMACGDASAAVRYGNISIFSQGI